MRRLRLQRADRLWLAAVGLLILLQFWWLPGDRRLPDDSFSASVEGKRGVYDTLRRLSDVGLLPVVARETHRLIPDRPCTLVLLAPDRYPTIEETYALRQFVFRGNSLVIAPSWLAPDLEIDSLNIKIRARESFQRTGADISTGMLPLNPSEADETPEQIVRPSSERSGTSGPPPDFEPGIVGYGEDGPTVLELGEAQFVVEDLIVQSSLISNAVRWRTAAEVSLATYQEHDVLVGRSGPYTAQAAAWNYGSGRVVAVATPDAFSNHAMLDSQRAELAVRLINQAREAPGLEEDSPVVVSEFLNTSGAYQGAALLVGPDLRAGTLQLLTIAVLAAWWGFHRFGPAQRSRVLERRSLTESAAAVGTLYQRTGSGSHIVRMYLEYVSTRLKSLVGPNATLEDYRIIALRARLPEAEVKSRISDAVAASRQKTTNVQAATCIRDLARLLAQLSG